MVYYILKATWWVSWCRDYFPKYSTCMSNAFLIHQIQSISLVPARLLTSRRSHDCSVTNQVRSLQPTEGKKTSLPYLSIFCFCECLLAARLNRALTKPFPYLSAWAVSRTSWFVFFLTIWYLMDVEKKKSLWGCDNCPRFVLACCKRRPIASLAAAFRLDSRDVARRNDQAPFSRRSRAWWASNRLEQFISKTEGQQVIISVTPSIPSSVSQYFLTSLCPYSLAFSEPVSRKHFSS